MKSNKTWLKKYSAMFAVTALALLGCFLIQNKHLIGETDAVHQHFTALCHIRQIFVNLLSGKGFEMVDLQLGQGLDTIGTLSYYGLADPLNWIAAFFPLHLMEYAYALIVFLRFYLVGLTFGFFLQEIELRDGWGTAISALVYTFSGFYLKAILVHPYFSDGGMYLALMLIATERLLKQRKWLMMVLATAVMIAANYYFAFKTTLLLIAYIVMRLCFRFKERGLKETAADGFSLMGAYLLGAMLAAVYFVPVLVNYMGNARLDETGRIYDSLLHYGWKYYLNLLLYFCAPYMTTGAWMHENFAPIALFGLMLLFMLRSKGDRLQKQLRCGFVIVLVLACIPAVGRLFNGWGYVCNRWCYAFAMAVCAALAWALPKMMERENGYLKGVALLALGYAALMIAGSFFSQFANVLLGALALIAFSLFLLIYQRSTRLSRHSAMRLLAVATVLCCIAYEASIYLPLGGSYAADYGKGRFADKLANETASAALAIDDDEFCRVDTGYWDDCHQSIQGYNGTSFYWSVVPHHVSTCYRDLELGGLATSYWLKGLNGSTVLNALSGVKYALRDRDENLVLPYGYEKIDEVVQNDGDTVDIYKNSLALPIGYVFEKTMSKAQYDGLNPVEKQAALLSCAVIEDGDEAEFVSPVQEIEWSLEACHNAQFDEASIVTQTDGSLSLCFASLPDSETYIDFAGLRYIDVPENSGRAQRFESEAGRSVGIITDPTANAYYAQKGICVNLGYSEDGLTGGSMIFKQDSVLGYDSIKVYSLPMAYYRTEVEKLRANGLSNVAVSNNRISGSVTLDHSGVLQISVPYSEGWTATVNGEEAEIVLCGGMYMGIALETGENSVELRYVTPALQTGAKLSAAAAVIIVVLCIFDRRKRRAVR